MNVYILLEHSLTKLNAFKWIRDRRSMRTNLIDLINENI